MTQPASSTPNGRVRIARAALVAIGALIAAYDLSSDALHGRNFFLGTSQVIVLAAALAMVAIGIAWSRLLIAYVASALIVATLVVMLAGAELLSTLLKFSKDAPPSPYLEAQEWGTQITVDQSQSGGTFRYEPFTVARQGFFRSRTVNIDSSGRRQTPGTQCVPGAFRLLMFGGSTLWGFNAPDSGTIPAYLQKSLASAADRPICIVNYGEWSWVSTQEVVQLVRALAEGEKADGIIFYDGINDVSAPVENGGQVGAHLELEKYRARLSGRKWSLVRQMLLESNLASRIREMTVGARATNDSAARHAFDAFIQPVIDTYASNYRVASAIADSRGIPIMFFWQPALPFGDKPLHPGEQAICRGIASSLRQFNIDVYRAAAQQLDSLRNWRDISRLFDGYTTIVFVDEVHITPEANARVAQAMAEQLWTDPLWRKKMTLVRQIPALLDSSSRSTRTTVVSSCEASTTRGQ